MVNVPSMIAEVRQSDISKGRIPVINFGIIDSRLTFVWDFPPARFAACEDGFLARSVISVLPTEV